MHDALSEVCPGAYKAEVNGNHLVHAIFPAWSIVRAAVSSISCPSVNICSFLKQAMEVCKLPRMHLQDGRQVKSRAPEAAEHMLVDQAYRRALVRLSSSAAEAGIPVMQWRQDGGGGDEKALPRLLHMALHEPTLDTSEHLCMRSPCPCILGE